MTRCKRILPAVSICLLLFLFLNAFFIVLLTASASIPPTRKFHRRMCQSARILKGNGDYPFLGATQYDNYTDSLILNIAYGFDPQKPFHSAMGAIYRFSEEAGSNGTRDFFLLVNQKQKMQEYKYSRYWFGQSAMIRLVHFFWNLNKIYPLIGAVSLLLALFSFLLVWNKIGPEPAMSLAFLLMLCHFHTYSASLQYWPVLWLALGELIFLLRNPRPSWRLPTFFVSGTLCAFLDLLTYPVLAWGVPALFLLFYDRAGEQHQKEADGFTPLGTLFLSLPFWGAGYVSSWFFKILLGGVTSGNWQGLKQLLLRSSAPIQDNTMEAFSRWSAISENFDEIYSHSQIPLLAGLAIFAGWGILRIFRNKRTGGQWDFRLLTGCLFVAVLPMAVILITAQHAYSHSYMTCRGLTLTLAALCLLPLACKKTEETR